MVSTYLAITVNGVFDVYYSTGEASTFHWSKLPSNSCNMIQVSCKHSEETLVLYIDLAGYKIKWLLW